MSALPTRNRTNGTAGPRDRRHFFTITYRFFRPIWFNGRLNSENISAAHNGARNGAPRSMTPGHEEKGSSRENVVRSSPDTHRDSKRFWPRRVICETVLQATVTSLLVAVEGVVLRELPVECSRASVAAVPVIDDAVPDQLPGIDRARLLHHHPRSNVLTCAGRLLGS